MGAKFSTKIERANEAVHNAMFQLLEVMEKEYPLNSKIIVKHSRGSFYGVVVGHDVHGVRIKVLNSQTLKMSKWWYRHIESTK
jgi:3'-phosphoadenosine 5'-phosphosulfate sulfotransferase